MMHIEYNMSIKDNGHRFSFLQKCVGEEKLMMGRKQRL